MWLVSLYCLHRQLTEDLSTKIRFWVTSKHYIMNIGDSLPNRPIVCIFVRIRYSGTEFWTFRTFKIFGERTCIRNSMIRYSVQPNIWLFGWSEIYRINEYSGELNTELMHPKPNHYIIPNTNPNYSVTLLVTLKPQGRQIVVWLMTISWQNLLTP